MLVIVIVAVVVLIGLALVLMYNRLVRLRNRTENSWSQVDVQLPAPPRPDPQPRRDGEGLRRRTSARRSRRSPRRAEPPSRPPASRPAPQAENALTAAIGRLFAVAEAYPELRASENFQQLQAQLEETEQKIAVARQVYNDTVLTYDTAIETVPTNIVAGMFNFEERPYFELAAPEAAAAPQVRF